MTHSKIEKYVMIINKRIQNYLCGIKETAYRPISIQPLVTNDDMAFIPKPSPSHIPAANAMTFFIAPPSSTPLNLRKSIIQVIGIT